MIEKIKMINFLREYSISFYKVTMIMGNDGSSMSGAWKQRLIGESPLKHSVLVELCQRLEIYFKNEKGKQIEVKPEMFDYSVDRVIMKQNERS